MRVQYPDRYRATALLLDERLRRVESDCILNWGYSGTGDSDDWINKPKMVKRAANKANAKMIMWVRGVPTPMPMTPEYAAFEMEARERLMIGREDRTGQGRRLLIASTASDVREKTSATHWCDWIKADEEYRVHVVADKVIKISEKVNPDFEPGGHDFAIRSHNRGWTFQVPTLPKGQRGPMRMAAKDAVRALGLDFGAVDVLRQSSTGEVWVLEVNTAPALTDATSNTLDKYVRAFTRHWGG